MLSCDVPVALLQPDLAEGEEPINEYIVELQEELHKQVALHRFSFLCWLYGSPVL